MESKRRYHRGRGVAIFQARPQQVKSKTRLDPIVRSLSDLMNAAKLSRLSGLCGVLLSTILTVFAPAQTCLTHSDMDEPTRSALESSAQRYFDMAARGDTAALKQNAIAGLA